MLNANDSQIKLEKSNELMSYSHAIRLTGKNSVKKALDK